MIIEIDETYKSYETYKNLIKFNYSYENYLHDFNRMKKRFSLKLKKIALIKKEENFYVFSYKEYNEWIKAQSSLKEENKLIDDAFKKFIKEKRKEKLNKL